MFLPSLLNSRYESDYECICIVVNGKICSVPLNILSSVHTISIHRAKCEFLQVGQNERRVCNISCKKFSDYVTLTFDYKVISVICIVRCNLRK